jgi:hypothetical protein
MWRMRAVKPTMTQIGSEAVQIVGWVAIGVAALCALAIAADIARGNRQKMAIMNAVWPITALYWGPVALWAYLRRGRSESGDPPHWWSVSKGTGHCGAGCTLGDLAGEWIVWATGLTIGGFAAHKANTLLAMFVLDFAFAWTFGIVFQYFSIVPMRDGVGRLQGIWLAIKADTLSIVAFQVGLFGYMALFHLVFWDPPLDVASPAYWWQMQIGMVLGYFTSWPVNSWLIKRGWKEAM